MFQNLCYVREQVVDTVTNWLWIKDEKGLWEGPHEEWPVHKEFWYSFIPEKKVVIQAGGAFGMYPRLHANYFQRVYTFEPNPLSFFVLNNNCQLPNIFKFNCALGKTPSFIDLNVSDRENMGTHSIVETTNNHVPMLTIDSFNWDRVDFIQLDVECYEKNVIEGGMKTIEKFKPAISAELGESLIEILGPLGYKRRGKTGADTLFSVDP